MRNRRGKMYSFNSTNEASKQSSNGAIGVADLEIPKSSMEMSAKEKLQEVIDHPQKKKEIADSTSKNKSMSQGPPKVIELKSTKDVKPIFHISFKKLLELSNFDDNNIIMELIPDMDAFSELLATDSLKPDWIALIILILSKIGSSSFKGNKVTLLSLAADDWFVRSIGKVIMLAQYKTLEERRGEYYFWNNIENFFVNLLIVCESWIEVIPSKACSILPKLLKLIEICIPVFQQRQDVVLNEIVKNKIKNLLSEMVSHGEVKKEIVAIKNIADPNPPPDDFRSLSVYPSREEILTSTCGFVRKQIIEGGFASVNHYLDVQFRLLKEDFIAPLRQGIAEYFKQDPKKVDHYLKLSKVRIHSDVIFLVPCIVNNQMGVTLKLSAKNTSQTIFAPTSKRFRHGSLVCFTKDNFTTILLGKILQRDLSNNLLIIGFEPEYQNYEFYVRYLMVECKIYFEPYYHVLKALQNISEQDFPMKSYLIDAISSVDPPNYVNKLFCRYMIEDNGVELLGQWPSADYFQLNSFQFSAFKAALTQKFVIIQGPPGTGKTYVGLKIVKTLLHEKNLKYWYNKTPILVVCYTNHALDQFLEGLISTTNRIVRVGGQSKNDQLTPFNLKNLRSDNRTLGDIFHSYRRNLDDLLCEIKVCENEIKEIDKFESIIRFGNFKVVDPKFHASWFDSASDAHLLAWLFAEQASKNIKIDPNISEFSDDNKEKKRTGYSDDEEADEEYQFFSRPRKIILISINGLGQQISSIRDALKTIKTTKSGPTQKKWKLKTDLDDLTQTLSYLKMKLQDGKSTEIPEKPSNVDYVYPNRMPSNDRWNLYFYWVRLYKNFKVEKLMRLQEQHQKTYKRYLEARQVNDTEVMKNRLVVGMTTTGAARLQPILRSLKCRIVVVEEAAEVLESHVTVSMTSHCEHLILIGDHQQLRPSTADYRIETNFNLGISMFERMVMNKIQCHYLGIQHRMRPEIAKLISPHIYPILENHLSVNSFPPVVGIDSSLYFIHHEHKELGSQDESKSNIYEAKFLLKLACYLIQNGYHPEDVTILSAYSAQMLLLREERKNYDLILRNVEINVLDNYQGKESKIILLSLVRNNQNGKIGFLKIENRVCVALSRAREGFYIMGNMDLLCEKSDIWPKIKEAFVNQNSLGSSLTLRCQVHPDNVTIIEKPEDFDRVPGGGCNETCGSLMSCGHNCTKVCHVQDRAHTGVLCQKPCTKVLCKSDHVCPKKCHEVCGECTFEALRTLECGHEHILLCHVDSKKFECTTPLSATLPCGHEVTGKLCHQDLKHYRCQVPCGAKIETCGHICKLNCHTKDDPQHKEYKCTAPCNKIPARCRTKDHKCPKLCYEECPPCKVILKRKIRSCNHVYEAECGVTSEDILCKQLCNKKLKCNHLCKRKCYEECGDCIEIVHKLLPECGHGVMTMCSESPNIKNCRGRCLKLLKCGHVCKQKCNEPCTITCKELVNNDNSAFCGHKFKIMCHLRNMSLPSYCDKLLQFCKEPCTQILECSHKCSGTCGECLQGRIHVICKEKCGVTLICGHVCEIPCREACQPCKVKCSLTCSHTKCRKKCGKQCEECKKCCPRQCKHVQCTAKCGEICTVPPCEESCDKMLPCSHPCMGFCSDPCPPFCKTCDGEKLREKVFGYEENSRIVLLEECKHAIDSKRMELRRMHIYGDVQIGPKKCPKCGIALTSTQRYSDYVKQTVNDITSIQRKNFGSFYEREAKCNELQHLLDSIEVLQCDLVFTTPKFAKFLKQCNLLLGSIREDLSLLTGKSFEAKLCILRSISQMLKAQKISSSRKAAMVTSSISATILWEAQEYLELLFKILTKKVTGITNQQCLDFEREVWRLQRIAQFVYLSTHSECVNFNEIQEAVYKPVIYTENYDKEVKLKLEELGKQIQCGDELTNKEYCRVVKVMNWKRGLWFKCSKGHHYISSEFGGAVPMIKCYKCMET